MMQRIQAVWRFWRSRGPVVSRAGFSLIEILMVLLILSVGILPMAIVHHRARREVTEADQYTQALAVAQSQMERIKGMGFGNAAADSGQEGIIKWECSVTNVTMGLDRIEVTSSWQGQGGEETLMVADLVSLR